MRNRIPCRRDAGTRLATASRRRPFPACNKGNRRRLHAGNLFWTSNRLNELPEMHVEFPFNLTGKLTIDFFDRPIIARTQILVHSWGPRTRILGAVLQTDLKGQVLVQRMLGNQNFFFSAGTCCIVYESNMIMLSKNQSGHSPGSPLINLCTKSCKLIHHGRKPSVQQ